LAAAGYKADLPIKVYSYQASAPAPAAVEAYTNYLHDIGVNAIFTNIEVGSLIRLWLAHAAYPMSFIRVWGSPDPSGLLFRYLHSQGEHSFASDPKFDALWDTANLTAEPTAHAEALKKIYHYIQEQAYVIYLYAIVENQAIGPRVDWRYPQGNPSHLEFVTWRQ
jgi:ABC-type transport system substrate-binding protein